MFKRAYCSYKEQNLAHSKRLATITKSSSRDPMLSGLHRHQKYVVLINSHRHSHTDETIILFNIVNPLALGDHFNFHY